MLSDDNTTSQDCDIVAIRVKSGDNMADMLSRGKDKRTIEEVVMIEIPKDLQPFVNQVV